MQSTLLYRYFYEMIDQLAIWATNPWRRYSLLLITFLVGFLLGSSLGMINGVLALMDPIGALVAVFLLEVMIKMRLLLRMSRRPIILTNIIDIFRIGIVYGLFTEALKIM